MDRAGLRDGDEELLESLGAALRSGMRGQEVEVRNLHRISGGNSRETWSFDAVVIDSTHAPEAEPLILTRDPLGNVMDAERRTEARLLSLLSDTRVPAPRLHYLDEDGSMFGRPGMIVERCDGKAVRGILRDEDPLGLGEAGRLSLAASICDVLVDLHSVDPARSGASEVFPAPRPTPAEAELDAWEARLDAVRLEPLPGLDLARVYLRAHLPAPPQDLVLVHGDYRPANIMVSDGGITAVIDWEFAHLGDFHDDLGWYLAPNYRRDHFIPSRWTVREFLARYESKSGRTVDPAALRFWVAMACFRLAVLALTEVRNFCAGVTDRPWAPADLNVRKLASDAVDALLFSGDFA